MLLHVKEKKKDSDTYQYIEGPMIVYTGTTLVKK
jgi:hypothetical protein